MKKIVGGLLIVASFALAEICSIKEFNRETYEVTKDISLEIFRQEVCVSNSTVKGIVVLQTYAITKSKSNKQFDVEFSSTETPLGCVCTKRSEAKPEVRENRDQNLTKLPGLRCVKC